MDRGSLESAAEHLHMKVIQPSTDHNKGVVVHTLYVWAPKNEINSDVIWEGSENVSLSLMTRSITATEPITNVISHLNAGSNYRTEECSWRNRNEDAVFVNKKWVELLPA